MAGTKKTVVVTGGSRGIGREICRKLASPDSKIFFNFFSFNNLEEEKKAAEETVKMINKLGVEAESFCANIADKNEVEAFFDKIINETERIDLLVNNAGITKDAFLIKMKDEDWDAVLNVNLKGAFLCTKIASKLMMRQKRGRIINITSVVGVAGNAGQCNYSASKAGLIGLTKSAAKELAARNITVNAVAPGFIETDMTRNLKKETKKIILSQIPLKRAGSPADVASAVEFLASPAASYITGQVLHVSGGMYM